MAVLGSQVRMSGPGEDIWVAGLLRSEVRISGPGEDIWVAVLGPEVRISGPGEDIWVAVVKPEVRISGPVGPPCRKMRPHICSPLGDGDGWRFFSIIKNSSKYIYLFYISYTILLILYMYIS